MKKPSAKAVLMWIGRAVIFLGGVGAGIAVAQLPAPKGDVLSFSGALLGAVIAIGGGIYVFARERQHAKDNTRDVLTQLLLQVRKRIEAVRDPKDPGGITDFSPAQMCLGNVDQLKESIRSVQSARAWFTPDSARVVSAYAQIEMMAVDKDAIRADLGPSIVYGGMPVLDRHLSELEIRCKLAIKMLGG